MAWNERLATWFGLSYASWLTIPRSMIVQMSDDWQERLFELMEEYDEAWPNSHKFEGSPFVQIRHEGKIKKCPEYILNYRHPNPNDFEFMRGKK